MRFLLLVVRAFILARRLLSFLATRLFQLIFRLASVVHIRGLTLGMTQDLTHDEVLLI